jgi:hypothetical protein
MVMNDVWEQHSFRNLCSGDKIAETFEIACELCRGFLSTVPTCRTPFALAHRQAPMTVRVGTGCVDRPRVWR